MVTFFTVLLRGSNSIHPIQTAAPGLDKRPSLGWLRTAGRPWVPDSCSGCAAPALSRSRSLSVSVIKWHCFIGVTLPPFSFSVCVYVCLGWFRQTFCLSVLLFCVFHIGCLSARQRFRYMVCSTLSQWNSKPQSSHCDLWRALLREECQLTVCTTA